MARRRLSQDATLADRLRAFQKSLAANKRCADCTELGPTYVCIDFQTFVCQTCSGIHREFGHKMKSISLSEWRESEVESIEQGGNDKAAQIWLAKFRTAQLSVPTNVEPDKVRDFIRQKYVEKKWWKPHSDANESSNQTSGETDGTKKNGVSTGNNGKRCSVRSDQSQSRQDGGVEAPRLAAPSTVVATSDWTADFSSVQSVPPTPPPVSAASPNGQWVADFSTEVEKVPASASNNGACHGINPSLLGLDFTASVPSKEDELEAKIAPVLAAVAEATTTPGDQLRHAVLNGSGDAVRRLYEESWHNPAMAPMAPQYTAPLPPTQFFNIGDDESSFRRMSGSVPPQPMMVATPYQAPFVASAVHGPAQMHDNSKQMMQTAGGSVCIFDDDDITDNKNSSQFDDLILAFQEKNPVLGFDL